MKKLTALLSLGLLIALVAAGLQPADAAANLPNWSGAGYRGTGNLPGSADITSNASCVITPSELQATYNVVPNDNNDDAAGIQSAIDTIRTNCSGGYNNLSLIEFPAGTLNISTEIHVDASFLILRGQGNSGSNATQIVFEPDNNTIYSGISDFDLGDINGPGSSNGGWIWPGRGAFRVQTREVHSSYSSDYNSAGADVKDLFEGSVNFHWKGGIEVTQSGSIGDTTITLDSTSGISVGDSVWVGAPNTENMYNEQNVDSSDWRWFEYMRQQIFTVTAVNGNTITIDKPLEFDLPKDSTADGSSAIDGSVRDAKVIPLVVVEGVGLENFHLSQNIPGLSASQAQNNYNNLDHERAQHGIVLKWTVNTFVRDVHTEMTGSHALVTEMSRHIQIENNNFNGSWNKGKGGNGYLRLSKLWDSRMQGNTMRDLRHLAIQWSASSNIIQNNDIDADINLHGGWERYNLIQNNTVRVPYEHRDCNPNCSAGSETWYPIWWAAGDHAGGWSGPSGPQNIFYQNILQKQLISGGAYEDYAPYGTNPDTLFMFGWDRDTPEGSQWVHLQLNGTLIDSWTSNEEQPFYNAPNAGVNDLCTSTASSLVGASITCDGEVITPEPTTAQTQTPTLAPTSTTLPPDGSTCDIFPVYDNLWNDGMTVNITITNIGTVDIDGWSLEMRMRHGEIITDFYNVSSYSQVNDIVYVDATSSHYNGDIDVGDSVTIKYKADHTGVYYLPTDFKLNGVDCTGDWHDTSTTPIPPPPTSTSTTAPPTIAPSTTPPPTTPPPSSDDCTVTGSFRSEWSDGYTADLIISNDSSNDIVSWELTMEFANGESVTNFWRVSGYDQSGATLTAEASSSHYNGDIDAGDTTDIRFQVNHNGSYGLPTNFTLNGQPCN